MKIYSGSELNTEAREAMLLAFQYPITVKGEIDTIASGESSAGVGYTSTSTSSY